MRTVKLVCPLAVSYHAISCRINDSKNLQRIRVTCLIAARLKQSTQKMPDMNCNIVDIIANIPYAIESFIISWRFSSSVALLLYVSTKCKKKKKRKKKLKKQKGEMEYF